jgi:hypothetical protein
MVERGSDVPACAKEGKRGGTVNVSWAKLSRWMRAGAVFRRLSADRVRWISPVM